MSSPQRRLRVLVVDDSALHRQILTRILARDPDLELAGYAANGAEAVRAVEQLRPDVVTLDERMPVMDGLEAARRIMRDWPTPIVLVTSAAGLGARDIAEAALAAGVLAVQDKRALVSSDDSAAGELVRIVKGMAAVRLVRRRRTAAQPADASGPSISAAPKRAVAELIAVGASTGGPHAIRTIISRFPADFPLPILVVQHTTVGYSAALADWLRAETALPIQIAQDGQAFDAPGVFLAPTERHLVVRGNRLALLDTPPSSLHRPSATVLFRSVASSFGSRAIGVLLTGMGDDGAAGLAEMKQAGALTIAQDEASSVVFGMPAEAIRLGAVDHVLPPEQIARLLLDLAAVGRHAA
ncbi:MAG: chemotaxis-specific protein-glutamate methyltransferase CheB [Chloroflexota bacterium]|nr:chemotaxis-specific protein-glutamate methyltransferase CheB [Chloroflexota bacterium]